MVCYSCSVPYLGKVKENNKKIEVDYAPIWIAGMILYMYHGALCYVYCVIRVPPEVRVNLLRIKYGVVMDIARAVSY